MEASSVMVTANRALLLLKPSLTLPLSNNNFKQQKLVRLTHNTTKKRVLLNKSHCKALKTTICCSSSSSSSVVAINESEFNDVVLKAERPVLVEFVANWCGPCRLVAPSIDSLAQEYKERITVVKIDHDANPNLIKEYEVYGLPTLILFKNGQPVPDSKREGAITKAKLKEYIDGLLESLPVA